MSEAKSKIDITKPEIDVLLEKTDQNPFLLCSVASKRASDINNMVRGQHLRVANVQEFDDITTVISGQDTTSIAMKEIASDTLGYVKDEFDEAIKSANAPRTAE